MGSKKNLLVTLADKNYIQQAKQLFSSVYWNAGWEGDYMLLSHGIPESDLNWFYEKGIFIRKCEPLYDKNIAYIFSHVVLDKFYLFTEEFKKWNNVIFLDADIIVRSSLNGLTKIKRFGAVQDCYINKLYTQFFIWNFKTFWSDNKFYNLNKPAFNSGVFSFNTKIITSYTFNELTSLFKEHTSTSKFGEQPVMNLYFYNKWEKLPLFYNTIVTNLNFKTPLILQPIVLHFIRHKDRPPLWDPKNAFYQEWKTNLEKAEFIDLSKVQLVKDWNVFKQKYYSLLFFIKMVIIEKLKKIFFIYEVKSFFIYKLKYVLHNAINMPDRMMGKIGSFLKRNNANLYYKLRKIKDGK